LVWPFGELELSERLEELRKACENFFGALAEVRMNLRAEVPDKPVALMLTQQCVQLGLPLVQGAVLDQPYIWMMEYRICLDTEALFDAIRRASESEDKDANK
jgi:hypothetical protein